MVLLTSPIKTSKQSIFTNAPPNMPKGGLTRPTEVKDDATREAELAFSESLEPHYAELPYDTPQYLLPSVRSMLSNSSTKSGFSVSQRPFGSSSRSIRGSRSKLPVPKLPWRIPEPPKSDPQQVQRLYEDAKRKNDRWQSRMFDPPIEIDLKDSLGQVRKEERAKMKAKISAPAVKPHLPRQPTSLSFQYNYINSRQKRAVKKQRKTEKRQIRKQTKAISKRLKDTRRDNQEEYSPYKKRQPPPHTKAKPLDVYSKGQFEQLYNPELQQASFERQQRELALHATLFELQKHERQVRMMKVKKDLRNGMEDPQEYKDAAKAEATAKAAISASRKDLLTVSRQYSSTILNKAEHTDVARIHDDLPQRIDEMFQDGEKHNLRWPTRMFDPPIEIPLKNVLKQIEKEHRDTIKAKKSPAPSPHRPRQETSRHFNFAYTTTTEKVKFDDEQQQEREELIRQQQLKQTRMEEIRKDHQEEFNIDKQRSPPAEIRAPPKDELARRQHDQWHDEELHRQTQQSIEANRRLEKQMFEQQRQNREMSAMQNKQRLTMHFEDQSAYEEARATEQKLQKDAKISTLQIDTLCLESSSNILRYAHQPPLSAKDYPPLRKDQQQRIEELTADEKRVADRWKNRMFDPPVEVPLNVVLKQVEDEVSTQVKRNASSGKLAPHYPRQPTSLHFEYDYINTAQQKREEGIADKMANDSMEQQKRREQRRSMKKAEQQAQYLPDSPRSPPKSARAPPADVFNRMQLDQIHKKEIHDETANALQQRKMIQRRLEDLQTDERQQRVSLVVQQKTEKFEDKTQFEQAKALEEEKRRNILKQTVEIDHSIEKATAIVPTKPSEHADRLFADGQKHHDRWQTRMFDPPVEIELKEVLKQVETEHHAAVKRNTIRDKPQPHYPRKPGIGHLDYDYTTTTEMKKVKAKEEEDMKISQVQHEARLKRKTIMRESNKAEYDVNKPRAPPAEARAPPADAYSRKQEEQFKDEKVAEVLTGAFLSESLKLQEQYKGQEAKRKTMRAEKTAEDTKQRHVLSESLKKQKEKRATKVNQLIGADIGQRPMTANDSSYSTQVPTRPGVEMQYYDPNEDAEVARPKTAPSQSMKVHDAQEENDDQNAEYDEYDDNDGFGEAED